VVCIQSESRKGELTQGKGEDADEGLEAYEEEGPDKGGIFGAIIPRTGLNQH
jgi:hypothetical protein